MPTKGQQTRKTIVTAARALFYHQGYAATSYADIGQKTGLGKGNIHYYFKSKDDILHAVVTHRLEEIELLLEQWNHDYHSPEQRIQKFIDMIANNAADISNYGCPMGTLNGELGKNDKELQLAARKMFEVFLHWLESCFEATVAKEKAQQYALTLMIMAQGTSVLAHSLKRPELVRQQGQIMYDWLAELFNNQ